MNEVLLNLLDEFERKQETIDNAIEVEKIYRKRIALLEQVSQDQALTISQMDYAYTIDKETMEKRIAELEVALKNKCNTCGLAISHGIWGDEDSVYDDLPHPLEEK